MKTKTAGIVFCLAVIVILTVGSIAYFTSKDRESSAFTIGDVEIELDEPGWDPEEDHLIKESAEITKDPVVKNTGNIDCWVRINIVVDKYSVLKGIMEQEVPDFEPDSMFTGYDSAVWLPAGEPGVDTAKDTVKYMYYYHKVLPVGDTTEPLFTAVRFPDDITPQMKDMINDMGKFTISVSADAVQKGSFGSAEEAFDKFE